eukprot:4434866-Amphidinium_carterae.1
MTSYKLHPFARWSDGERACLRACCSEKHAKPWQTSGSLKLHPSMTGKVQCVDTSYSGGGEWTFRKATEDK